MAKKLCFCLIVSFALFLIGCINTQATAPSDKPLLTSDEVVAASKARLIEVALDGKTLAQLLSGDFTATYVGKGEWQVVIKMPSPASWSFWEKTGTLSPEDSAAIQVMTQLRSMPASRSPVIVSTPQPAFQSPQRTSTQQVLDDWEKQKEKQRQREQMRSLEEKQRQLEENQRKYQEQLRRLEEQRKYQEQLRQLEEMQRKYK